MFGNRQGLRKRLSTAEEKLEKLEREIKSIQLDWENTYDKMRSMMGRMAKRAEAMHQDAEERGELHNGNSGFSPEELIILSHLPPVQRAHQEKILRRRKMMRGEG